MRILGIDPGLANTGYGIVDFCNGRYRMVNYGSITTTTDISHQDRLLAIYNRLALLIDEYKPDYACLEALYFSKNAKSALKVSEARGVVFLCFAQNCIPINEYTPNEIKKAVTGNTTADKNLVQTFVKLLLGLNEMPQPDHAADALACAITHIHSVSYRL